MIVQVVQESPQEKIRIGGTKDCNNEFILLSAISLLVYVSKKENLSYLPLVNSGGWVYPVKSIFPLTTIKFENIEFPAPCNPDSVLKILYGDYMTLPPVEERQIHATFIKTNLF